MTSAELYQAWVALSMKLDAAHEQRGAGFVKAATKDEVETLRQEARAAWADWQFSLSGWA